MQERVNWIDGMKGYACLIVLFGHSVACIFPNIFFGDSYQAHYEIERFIHSGVLMLFFSSSSMVGIFCFLSGYLLVKKEQINIFRRFVNRYLKLIPMILFGVVICYLVMKCNLTYHIKLIDISYAETYVGEYNNFGPSVLGENGILVDACIKAFVTSSRYNNTLWFIAVSFWGSFLTELILKCVPNIYVRCMSFMLLYVTSMYFKILDWKIPYLGFIFAGAIIGLTEFGKFKRKVSSIATIVMFAIGLYITAPNEYVGLYEPLANLDFLGLNLRVIGIALMVIAIELNGMLQKVFDTKLGKWLAKYSFGIYVIQWGVIISVSCGATYLLSVKQDIDYMIAGSVGILMGLVITVILSIAFTDYIYKPYCERLYGK